MTATAPRRWAQLTLAGTTAGLAALSPAAADRATGPETSWLAQAEGGEAGEAGLVAERSPEVALAIRLALVDAHLRAGVEAYRAGLIPEALGLVGHPEAEVMDELRPDLVARGVADFTDRLDTLSGAMADGADQATVEALYADAAGAVAGALDPLSLRARFDAVHALAQGAAIEYSDVVEDGTVIDPAGYLEAFGFLAVAKAMTRGLAADPALAEVTQHVLDALAETDAAFAAPGEAPVAVDPAILHGAAARVELAGLRLGS